MQPRITRRTAGLVVVASLLAASAAITATQERHQGVSLDAVVEIWASLVRDVDRVGLTITRISASREMEIGREIAADVARWQRPMASTSAGTRAIQAYVAGLGERLAAGAQREGIAYSFEILVDSAVNAYALPGGHVYVTTGMLDFVESEAELAAILGHEISHVDLRHCVERLQYEMAVRRVAGDDLAAIVSIGYSLIDLGFSEQQEIEADVGGMLLAAKAGYDPRAAGDVLVRLAAIEAAQREPQEKSATMIGELDSALIDALGRYFATHPPAALRDANVQQALARNAALWRNQRFYVGRENHIRFTGRWSVEHPDEWVVLP